MQSSAEPLAEHLTDQLDDQLAALAPQLLAQPGGGWWPLLQRWQASDAGRALMQALNTRLKYGAVIYPQQPLRALSLTPPAEVKVLILGQDPYHGAGQAEGLAFSVPQGVPWPPSLRNIFKEIQRDLGLPLPAAGAGSLEPWARQGVLLLNSTLTVEEAQAGSHAKLGWRSLTDAICQALWADTRHKVFMLWGTQAQAQARDVGLRTEGGGVPGPHLVLRSNHPSPLSALRPPVPFIGNGHFGAANRFLLAHGRQPIAWGLPGFSNML